MERLIFETDYWTVNLLDDQAYFGRCLVMLKRKCGSLSELTSEEMLDFLDIIRKYETVFKEKYGATMFNWTCLMNDYYKSDPPDPQVHWHCRPRYKKPAVFEGVEFNDPNFAHHYSREAKRVLDEEVRKKFISQLRSFFAK